MKGIWTAPGALLCAALISSCSAISIGALPQPGKSFDDGYDIVLEFANVLNLPDRAKVVLDGTTVGLVEKVELKENAVNVTARLDRSVLVPANVQAVLQQATVLGDIYVALDRPPSDTPRAPDLAPEAVVPLAQTTSPPQLEDTLADLANFVASGSIQRIQSTIINVNRVTPQRSEQIRAIASRMSIDLAALSNGIDSVDYLLNGLKDSSVVLAARIPQLQYWFSPAGMLAFNRTTEASIAIATLVPSIGSIYTGGFWLEPLLKSLGTALGAVQQSKQAIEGEYRPWRSLLNQMFLPQDKFPAMSITSIQTPDGREISGNVQDVLRMLGATP
jgi:phospholipid/cholesterol/gamma-HCH transport system substrate-binding protein